MWLFTWLGVWLGDPSEWACKFSYSFLFPSFPPSLPLSLHLPPPSFPPSLSSLSVQGSLRPLSAQNGLKDPPVEILCDADHCCSTSNENGTCPSEPIVYMYVIQPPLQGAVGLAFTDHNEEVKCISVKVSHSCRFCYSKSQCDITKL